MEKFHADHHWWRACHACRPQYKLYMWILNKKWLLTIWITAVFCECSYLCLNTTTSQITLSPHLQQPFNSKHEAYASVVGNRGEKHAYACSACSLLFHSLNDFWLHQDSGFPQEFSLFSFFDCGKIPDFLYTFFIFMLLIHDSGYDHACMLWSRLGFLQG